MVDRRPSQQVPVRLRIRAVDRERQAHADRQAAELSRHLREFLAQPERRGQRRHARGVWHADVRQGRAGAGHSRGACVAGLRVQRRRRVRRRMMNHFMSTRAGQLVDWQGHFTSLADAIERLQQGGETTLSSFAGEQSDFIRFNAGKVRQSGTVSQGKLTLRLIDGARQAYSTLTVCGDLQQDIDEVSAALAMLRQALRDAADDPHLLVDTSAWQRTTRRSGKLPDPHGLSRIVGECARGLDFVGFYAGGTIVRGFASTHGSRGWYEVDNFNFSWSLYDPSGRAIKTTYAGDDWSDAVFAAKVEQ